MSKQESMFSLWSTTLMGVLTGLLFAAHEMALVGEEEKTADVFGDDMRRLMLSCPSEARKTIVLMLGHLSRLAESLEPPS